MLTAFLERLHLRNLTLLVHKVLLAASKITFPFFLKKYLSVVPNPGNIALTIAPYLSEKESVLNYLEPLPLV